MDHDTPQLTGEDDMFITGAYRASRKPAQNATVCRRFFFDWLTVI